MTPTPSPLAISPATPVRRRRWFRRDPWENAATILIALGVFMLMQPFSITLYGWSFTVILTGTAVFTVAGKFPD